MAAKLRPYLWERRQPKRDYYSAKDRIQLAATTASLISIIVLGYFAVRGELRARKAETIAHRRNLVAIRETASDLLDTFKPAALNGLPDMAKLSPEERLDWSARICALIRDGDKNPEMLTDDSTFARWQDLAGDCMFLKTSPALDNEVFMILVGSVWRHLMKVTDQINSDPLFHEYFVRQQQEHEATRARAGMKAAR